MYMLNELWLEQRVPYVLLQTNDEYHYVSKEWHIKFSIPMCLMLLWESFESNCPLVSKYFHYTHTLSQKKPGKAKLR